jgi:hypothetical protein
VITEGDSFNVRLERDVTIPDSPSYLLFDFDGEFDTSSEFINDAFEVSFLASDGTTLLPTIGFGRDSVFNITEGELWDGGIRTTHDPTSEGDSPSGSVYLDISELTPGDTATLVMRLVNNDDDEGTVFRIEQKDAPRAVDDEFSLLEGTVLVLPAAGILLNDLDRNASDSLSVFTWDDSVAGLSVGSDGSFSYTPPDDDFYGDVTFTYTATDGYFQSNTATVTLHVLPVNDAPDATPDKPIL